MILILRYMFFSVEEFYWKKFYAIVDSLTVGFNKFNDTPRAFFEQLETFMINDDLDSTQTATEIIMFYKEKLEHERNYAERLILHRDMMLDLLNFKCTITSIHDIVLYFKNNVPA